MRKASRCLAAPVLAALAFTVLPAGAGATPGNLSTTHLYAKDVNWVLGGLRNPYGDIGTHGLPPDSLAVGTAFSIDANISRGNHLSHGGIIGPIAVACTKISATQARCDGGWSVWPDGYWLTQVIEYIPNINGPGGGGPVEEVWSTNFIIDLKNPFANVINGEYFEGFARPATGTQSAVANGHTGTYDITASYTPFPPV